MGFVVPLHLAAKALGVEHSHLRRVILGQRTSPELLAKYRAMAADLAEKPAAATT